MVALGISREQVLEWLGSVADPEIPVLTIADLGILRDVIVGDEVTVQLAPTYSGCPATEVIEQSVVDALIEKGVISTDELGRKMAEVEARHEAERARGRKA